MSILNRLTSSFFLSVIFISILILFGLIVYGKSLINLFLFTLLSSWGLASFLSLIFIFAIFFYIIKNNTLYNKSIFMVGAILLLIIGILCFYFFFVNLGEKHNPFDFIFSKQAVYSLGYSYENNITPHEFSEELKEIGGYITPRRLFEELKKLNNI